ncbi:MAG TPA: sulfotransferase [Rhizomicrobium sp.]
MAASDFTEAQAREILKRAPDNLDAALILGSALRKRGEARCAKNLLQSFVELHPGSARLRYELGQAMGNVGEHRSAVAVLSQAVNLDRSFAEAWNALGDQHFMLGDLEAANEAHVQHFNMLVRDPRLRKAGSLMREKLLEEAEDAILELLETDPDNVNAIKLLAEIAMLENRNDDAEELLARCVELAPDFTMARHRYATVLGRLARFEECIAQVEIILKQEPRNAGYQQVMASELTKAGRNEEAKAAFEKCLEEYPSVPSLWLGYGHALRALGQRDECIAAYRKAVELRPSLGGAWWSLANLKKFHFSPAEISAMETELARRSLGQDDRLNMFFALGKAHEDLKSYERAFDLYSRGNAIQRAVVKHDPAMPPAHIASCKLLFTQEFFLQHARTGCKAPDPIFIIGLPRAGSTLLEQILSCHSSVEGTLEISEVATLARRMERDRADGLSYPEMLADLDADTLTRLGEDYITNTRSFRKTTKPFFTDKMPNNFAHVGFMRLILPNARIIDARRHPMSCCFSNFKQLYAYGQIFSYSLEDVGNYYRHYVELMAYWDSVLPGRIHRVHYEDMVADPEGEVRRLLCYLGLPFEKECLQFYESDRVVRTASSEQVRSPIYKDSLEQWRHFEPWLGPLKEKLGPVLDAYPEVPDFGD